MTISSNADSSENNRFSSINSYRNFSEYVKRHRRYVWDDDARRFLDTVLRTRHSREAAIPDGAILWRAQLGRRNVTTLDDDGNEIGFEILGHPAQRMKPLRDGAMEGRVNPPGIPVLYLASCSETAVAEVRPWTGSDVSVARFKTLRDLKAIDLSQGYDESAWKGLTLSELLGESEPSPDVVEKVVWRRIGKAFSMPVILSESATEYVPTQILAELFAESGYDAIIYRSHFVENGYNIAIFDIDCAAIMDCSPYEVRKVKTEFDQIGNTWYMQDDGNMVVPSVVDFKRAD